MVEKKNKSLFENAFTGLISTGTAVRGGVQLQRHRKNYPAPPGGTNSDRSIIYRGQSALNN